MNRPSAGPAKRQLDTSFPTVHPTRMTPDTDRDASLATQSKMDVISTKDLPVEQTPGQELSDCHAFQIFPGSAEVPLGTEKVLSSGDPNETLPSIVVEPTYLYPLENCEHHRPHEDTDTDTDSQQEEADIFQKLHTSPSHLTDWQREGAEQKAAGNEEGYPNGGGVQRCQSNPQATEKLSFSHLTLPPETQCLEEMPPCLRS